MKKNFWGKAFALAEVIIVIGIIGIVAEIVMPILIKNVQNNALKAEFKKAYANLSIAYTMAIADNGTNPYQCFYDSGWNPIGTECTEFYDTLKTKLKVIKTYNSAADGVGFPNYLTKAEVAASGGTVDVCGCNGDQKWSKEIWLLADGSMIRAYAGTFIAIPFIIDTNGMKGPNKWGYDIFSLNWGNIVSTGYKIRLEDRICPLVEPGGFRVDDLIYNN